MTLWGCTSTDFVGMHTIVSSSFTYTTPHAPQLDSILGSTQVPLHIILGSQVQTQPPLRHQNSSGHLHAGTASSISINQQISKSGLTVEHELNSAKLVRLSRVVCAGCTYFHIASLHTLMTLWGCTSTDFVGMHTIVSSSFTYTTPHAPQLEPSWSVEMQLPSHKVSPRSAQLKQPPLMQEYPSGHLHAGTANSICTQAQPAASPYINKFPKVV
jgi:hypothetical protein